MFYVAAPRIGETCYMLHLPSAVVLGALGGPGLVVALEGDSRAPIVKVTAPWSCDIVTCVAAGLVAGDHYSDYT